MQLLLLQSNTFAQIPVGPCGQPHFLSNLNELLTRRLVTTGCAYAKMAFQCCIGLQPQVLPVAVAEGASAGADQVHVPTKSQNRAVRKFLMWRPSSDGSTSSCFVRESGGILPCADHAGVVVPALAKEPPVVAHKLQVQIVGGHL